MRLKNKLPSFKCKILKPSKKLARKLIKFRLQKTVIIRARRFRLRKTRAMNSTRKSRPPKITSVLRSLRPKRDMDCETELKSFSDAGVHKAPYPSPITPAYIRMIGEVEKEVSEQDEVKDACRSFENYLIEIIVKEGKMRDLVDVEELLQSWKNLKSPVFINLVCQFYAELCQDLFSSSCESDTETSKGIL